MCVNYAPTRKERIDALVKVFTTGLPDWPGEVWQDYAAPIIRAGNDGAPELIVGTYGMLPKAHMPPAAKHFTTMNARAETIGQKQSYSKAWRQGQTCLLPTSWFYEPNYESGKAERWAIGMEDGAEFCVAGLWRAWDEPEGGQSFSFTQITINADDHPLMKRFHKPGDEKRSLVIVPAGEYDAWLDCKDPEVARSMLTLYPAKGMKAWPAPRASKKVATTEGLF
ncbi:SOS response-associated peptidase [Herbaspirillum autotrophicum]|uniref:SOS response-associated peptidase n=1 Tax=Herbaspirillum autotrophicum TaxID=180195 RepID=UPI00067B3885|nr:SOS response-associated peptidase family protein [Herbaspirillum autotrophicum]